ncbi:hypothetical protein AYI70_g3544 [Smittium culicis]|uniref:Uncharacterized protein n=1 Tax=Smittium culicis TaxID=133412 RepID=A0A1R1Y3K3_9FUNG|nr:hypothetical protein AYI70_g3544 [Smittium culicis]
MQSENGFRLTSLSRPALHLFNENANTKQIKNNLSVLISKTKTSKNVPINPHLIRTTPKFSTIFYEAMELAKNKNKSSEFIPNLI